MRLGGACEGETGSSGDGLGLLSVKHLKKDPKLGNARFKERMVASKTSVR